jgi:hypothetical protein
MAFIDKIVKFHTFSKSTVRDNLTLGEAVNPSGHTVTSSQVRTDDIPAFIDTFQDTKTAALTWAATNVDANARHNDILYYGGKFNMGFSNPKCLIRVAKQVVDGKLVDLPAEQHTWADFTITDKSFLANADGKNVIAIHKGVDICYVHGDNNAAVNSNQNSAFVRKADGTFLDHFVAPTDQILGGQPSLGYGLCLFKSGTTKALTEGEETGKNNYIGNTFAGLIHFMDTRSETADASDNYKAAGFSVNCFEYIGDKLDTTLGNIREEIQDIVGVTMEGVVASVGTNDAAQNAGIGVDSTTKTSPKITFTAGSVATGETKLVSGGAVKTYVDTTALADGGSIASAIDTAVKIDEIKVKVGSGEATALVASDKSVTIEIPDVPAATVTEGEVTKDGFAKASDAVAIAQKEIENALDTSGAVASAIDTAVTIDEIKVKVGNGTATALTPDASKSVTIEIPEVQAATTSAAGVVTISSDAAIDTTATGNAAATVGAVAKTRTAIESTITTTQSTLQGNIDKVAGNLTTAVSTLEGKITAAQTAAEKHADDAVGALETKLTTGDGSLGSRVGTLEGSVETITKTTIPAAQAAAEKHADDAVAGLKTELTTGVIKTAQDTADQAVEDAADALAEAQKRISKVSEGTASDLLTVSTTGTEVTITLDGDVATKTHVAGEIKTVTEAATALTGRVTTAEGKIKTLEETTVPAVKTIAEKGVADAAAAAAAVTTLSDKLITSQAVTGAGVSVTLAGKVGAPTLTGSVNPATYASKVWSNSANVATGIAVESAVADALATAKAYSDSLHTSALNYVVADSLPTAAASEKGKVYLVKKGVDNVTALAGSYLEYMVVETSSGVYEWEQIGTTAADLSNYYTKSEVYTKTETEGKIQVVDDKVTELGTTHATDKAEIEQSITTLTGIVNSNKTTTDAAIEALAKADTGRVSVVEGKVSALETKVGTTAVATQIETAINALDSSETANGITVTLTDGKVTTVSAAAGTVAEGNTAVVTGGVVYTEIKKVSDLVGTTAVATQITNAINKLNATSVGEGAVKVSQSAGVVTAVSVTTETITSTKDMPTGGMRPTLVSSISDTTALITASHAIDAINAGMEDLHETIQTEQAAQTLVKSVNGITAANGGAAITIETETGFYGSELVTTDAAKKRIVIHRSSDWSGDSSTFGNITVIEVVNGQTYVNGGVGIGAKFDDANLVEAPSMFANNTSIGRFVGNLGKLTNGNNMFNGCTSLKHFCADLGSLTSGTGMFTGCPLSVESFMYIVDSLPEIFEGSSLGITVTPLEGEDATLVAELTEELEAKGWQM